MTDNDYYLNHPADTLICAKRLQFLERICDYEWSKVLFSINIVVSANINEDCLLWLVFCEIKNHPQIVFD